jgi:hypothetical protein
MQATKVFVLYRKDKPDEDKKINEIRANTLSAAKMINKIVDVEFTTNFHQFDGLSVNAAMTPIVVINKVSEFAGTVPSVEQMRKCLISTASPSEMF